MITASNFGLKANNFFVYLTGDPAGDQMVKTYDKYRAGSRDEVAGVRFTDVDLMTLTNLKLLYRHYKYSQHLIMTWMAEGQSFAEINHLVSQLTTSMRKEAGQKDDAVAPSPPMPTDGE